MALETNCLTSGCTYHTYVGETLVNVCVEFPARLDLSEEEAEEVEKLLHNQVELVIAYVLEGRGP